MAITSPSSLTCQLTVKKVQSQLQNIDDMLISMIAALLPNNLASKQTNKQIAHLTALMKPGIHACTQALHLAKSPQPQTMPLIAIKTGFKCQ